MTSKKTAKGFTLIELLIVVVIIGILAAIAIPNLLQALQKSKQKRTMADIRNIASAWEAYHVDQNSFVAAGAASTQLVWPNDDALTHTELQDRISPTYLRTVPRLDGWGTPLEFAASRDHYYIRSYGKDFQPDSSSYTAFETTVFNCDIVYSDGSFIVYPVGTQVSST